MASCPGCGREVPPAATFCPYCGTNVRQPAAPTTPPSYQPPQSYPPTTSYPQPTWETQPRHGHGKYIIAIILIGIIAFAAGYYIAYNLPIAPDVTILTGTASLNGGIQGTPKLILFYNDSTYYLSSIVYANLSYQAVLPIGYNYLVTIQWVNLTGGSPNLGNCTATPSTFSSSDQYVTQNFVC